MGKEIPGDETPPVSPDDIFAQVLAGMVLTDDEIAALGLNGITLDDEIEARIINGTAYLDFLSVHGIGGTNLKRALTRHISEAESLSARRVNVGHPYHSALFAFDKTTKILFDNTKASLGVDKTDHPEFFECFPVWARYSVGIAIDATENTIRSLIGYLHYFSELLMFARLLKEDGPFTLEEKLVPLEAVVIFLKTLKPLQGIRWQSLGNLENPDFFPNSDHLNIQGVAARIGPIPRTAEFIGDESMLAYNLVSAAYAAMNFHEEDVFSKADRNKARAYFEKHRKEMGKRAYLWDNLLKEVFDYADTNFPDKEETVDRGRREIIRRSEDAVSEQPGYEDHYYGEYFRELYGDLLATGDREALEKLKSEALIGYETVKIRLAQSRQWLSEHQLDSPEILEVLKKYEDDLALYIELLKADVYTMLGSTACVLFCLSPKLNKKVRDAVSDGSLIDIDNISLESILAVWGRLTIRPKGMRANQFLNFYETLHELLFSTIQNIAQMQSQNNLAGFAFLLNNLMLLFKIDKKGKTIKIDKFKQIARAAHNIYGRRLRSKARPIEVSINEDVLLYLIIDACNKLVKHEERDPYNKNDRKDTLKEVLELSRSEDAVQDEGDETKAKDFELCIRFLQIQLPKIFALADEMFADKKPQGLAVAMPAVAIPDGIDAPTGVEADGTPQGPAVAAPPGSPIATPDKDEDEYKLPGGADALLPPDYENEPSEIATFEQLKDVVKREWRINNTKIQNTNRRSWQAEATLAKSNCDAKATVVAGDFEGTAHIQHGAVKEIFIKRRNPQTIVFPSNLNCTGTAKLEVNKKSYLLHWQFDEEGQLAFVIGGKTYNEQEFSKGIPPLKNFYFDIQSIILRQLEKLLVRQERELNARTWGAVLPPEEIDRVEPIKTRGGNEIKPRFENLVGAISDGDGKAGPTVTVVSRKAIELLEMIRQKQPIFEDDANGIILYLKLDEKVEAGKRIEPIYMPCNTIQVLQAVAREEISLDEVFVMSSRHRVGRAGYHPHRDTENPNILKCTQRVPDEESEAVQHAIEGHFKVKLSTAVTDATAITIPKDGEAITTIIIGTHEQIEADAADTIPLEEVSRWARGERDEISQTTRDRIRAVVIETETGTKQLVTPEDITNLTGFRIFRVIFNAGQKPQFTIGSYESLAQVQRKLATVEPAVSEPAPV